MTSETPTPFSGFQEDKITFIRIPEVFFSQLLPEIESLTQLRLLLYIFWHFEQQQDNLCYVKLTELTSDPSLLLMMGDEKTLRENLHNLVEVNILLKALPPGENDMLYFINSPQGRVAVQAINSGEWQSTTIERKPIQLTQQKPNIFLLYEENIGPITPLMAEVLKEDEITFPVAWIKEAIEIAVKRNVRNWKYVQAILDRWQKEGRGYEQNRRDDSQDPGSYRKSWLGRE